MKPYILISTCLLNIPTKWDGESKNYPKLIELVKSGKAIFFCAEQGGGLPTPRIPSEIERGKTAKDVLNGEGKVLAKSGKDVTEQFIKGAQMALQICKQFDIKVAILKEKSPSCGSTLIYDGTYTGDTKAGTGVTAELLKQNGIKVYNEENYPENI